MNNDETQRPLFDESGTGPKHLPARQGDKDQAGRGSKSAIPSSDLASAAHVSQRLVQQSGTEILRGCVAQHIVKQLL